MILGIKPPPFAFIATRSYSAALGLAGYCYALQPTPLLASSNNPPLPRSSSCEIDGVQ